MLGKFNDENYDGVVLKIPSVFISVNEIQVHLQTLLSVLENCDKCKFMPDNMNNIYELENYGQKTEIAERNREELRKQNEVKAKRMADIVSGDIVLLEYKKEGIVSNSDIVRIGEKVFDCDDYMTNKLNIKKSFEDAVFFENNSFEKFKTFIKENFGGGWYMVEQSNEITFRWAETSFGIGYNANLRCNINVMYTQTVTGKARDGRYKYRNELLQYDEKGYFVSRGNERHYFEGYEIRNMELRKIKNLQQ